MCNFQQCYKWFMWLQRLALTDKSRIPIVAKAKKKKKFGFKVGTSQENKI